MNPSRTILIVDDDARGAALLADFLQAQGHPTAVLTNGLHVEPQVRRHEPALVLLDVGLPGLDGLDICRDLRRFSTVPIIMLSGRTDELDRTLGLEVGADDYVCKPYSPRELLARIKAHLRRAQGHLAATCRVHGFDVDDAGRRIGWEGDWLPLTPQEYRLLRKLLARPGQVYTRDELMDAADEAGRGASERAVDSHVKNLRRKLQAAGADGAAIVSLYGVGYRLDAQVSTTAA